MRSNAAPIACVFFVLGMGWCGAAPWARHVIDASLRGADGVRLGDLNRDGFPDIATGWEESGRIRIYLHPGAAGVRSLWPAVTVGEAGSPEDAFFADLDGDGVPEVISSCEGQTQQIFVHRAPADPARLLDPAAWRARPVAAADPGQLWMYGVPWACGGATGFIAGSKGAGGSVTLFNPSPEPDHYPKFIPIRLCESGWIMSLLAHDLDRDGRQDLIFSDRKGARRGVYWISDPASAARDGALPSVRLLGLRDREVMFVQLADANQDGRVDVLAAVKPRTLSILLQPAVLSESWTERSIVLPDSVGTAKAVCSADLDQDGRLDLLFSCEEAHAPRSGVAWMRFDRANFTGEFSLIDISGPDGVKFDRIEVLDLDGDGDLDVLTCEEQTNLGVIWYENPNRAAADRPRLQEPR